MARGELDAEAPRGLPPPFEISGGKSCQGFNECYNLLISALKVTAIGNSLGLILPKELAAHLGIQKGDHLHVLVTPRGIELSPFDPALDEQLTIGRSVMKRYRSALRKLAE
jgi:putative addiction module antidote